MLMDFTASTPDFEVVWCVRDVCCRRRVHAHISGFDDEDFDDDEEFEKEKVKINLQQTQHHFDFRDWRAKSTTRSGRTRSGSILHILLIRIDKDRRTLFSALGMRCVRS